MEKITMIIEYNGVLTIAMLKEIIQKFVDANPDTGEECEVWIGGERCTCGVDTVSSLNSRISEKGIEYSDLLLTSKYLK